MYSTLYTTCITFYRFLKRSNPFNCPGKTPDDENCTAVFTPKILKRFQVSQESASNTNEAAESENDAEAMEEQENDESDAENEDNTSSLPMNSTFNPYSQDLFDDDQMVDD